MNRSLALGSLICGVALLTSCSAGTASSPGGGSISTAASAQAAETAPASAAPESSAPAPTVDPSSIGIQKMQVAFGEGYIANVTLTWHQVDLVDQVALGCEAPSGANVVTKAVVAEGTIDYPVVNGFTPPANLQIALTSDGFDEFGTQLECSSAGYGPTATGYALNLPTVGAAASGAGTFNLVLGDVSVRTPNNPDGEFAGTYKNVEMRFGGATKCTFEGPGVAADEAFPDVCVVRVPE